MFSALISNQPWPSAPVYDIQPQSLDTTTKKHEMGRRIHRARLSVLYNCSSFNFHTLLLHTIHHCFARATTICQTFRQLRYSITPHADRSKRPYKGGLDDDAEDYSCVVLAPAVDTFRQLRYSITPHADRSKRPYKGGLDDDAEDYSCVVLAPAVDVGTAL
nr:hypothetical protein L203_05258 [Cryptococcus depauperatus CBS 7841]